jgi:hypothetical protein
MVPVIHMLADQKDSIKYCPQVNNFTRISGYYGTNIIRVQLKGTSAQVYQVTST